MQVLRAAREATPDFVIRQRFDATFAQRKHQPI
ncbi:MAG: hypothetical protein LBU73_01490 [Helicobacteraceae bacterium]|nr:hypothetical protein [Helicobacteraceae bacterium]